MHLSLTHHIHGPAIKRPLETLIGVLVTMMEEWSRVSSVLYSHLMV